MKKLFAGIFLITLISGLAYFYFQFTASGHQVWRTKFSKNMKCVKSITKSKMGGGYLRGTLENNEDVEIYEGLHKCNKLKRNDVVALNLSLQVPPIMRIIRGLPGDQFEVIPDKVGKTGWWIKINGTFYMFNTQPYYFSDVDSDPLLHQHAVQYKNIIPKDHYLILTVVPRGGSDSSTFGLISEERILGPVGRPRQYQF